ncbi:C-8,7-sterol isomerase [Hordeum vulgare]|nr:C-8,7-sterol isomerase [Hordeum vulgare]
MGAHPYVPASLDLPGYVPLRLTQLEILVAYLGTSLLVVAAVWLLSGNKNTTFPDPNPPAPTEISSAVG